MLSPEDELIEPAQFIPAAERFGLIGEIDGWVTDQALKLALRGHRVALNLSAHSLSDQAIVRKVREAA